ncbi:copper resistance CopC family protein [Actinophytocola sp. KF-1]
MHPRRLAAAFLLSAAAVLATATPAAAHAELIASDPVRDATLAAPPQQVQLTFNEPVSLDDDPVVVTGPGNVTWTVGQPVVAGAVVTAPVRANGPAGRYTLIYQVLSHDGDAVTGSVSFTLTAAAPPQATTTTTTTTEQPPTTTATTSAAVAPASDPDDGVPVWVWLLGAVAVLAAVVVVVSRAGRSRGTGS